MNAPEAETEVEAVASRRRRLHPLTPLLRGARSAAVVIAAISWQGFARFGLGWGSLAVLAAGLLGLVAAWLSWRFAGYRLADRELHVDEGVLRRRHRVIPLERLQTVEVVQPLLARPFGLAELRCEVVGASSTEAPLAYVTLAHAYELREQLLRASKPDAGPTSGDAAGPTAAEDEPESTAADPAPILTVATRTLVVSQLLTPPVFVLPFAAFAVIGTFLWQPDPSFFGLAGLITAVVGLAIQPLRRAVANHGFVLRLTEEGLQIKRGLAERRSQLVPLNRVTAVVIARPLLWRKVGWVRATVSNAGYAGQGAEAAETGGTVLPAGTIDQARLAATAALAGVDPLAIPLRRAPARARWCAPLAAPRLGCGLGPQVFAVRNGRITPELTAVPYTRIQSVLLVQNRLQRALRLATVRAQVAGGLGARAVARCRDLDEALELARELRRRAGLGALAPAPPLGPAPTCLNIPAEAGGEDKEQR